MRYVFYDDFKPGLLKNDRVVDISDVLDVKPYQTPQMIVEKFITQYENLKPKLEKSLEKQGKPLKDVRLRQPVPKPSLFMCGIGGFGEGEGRKRPINFFIKGWTSIIGPNDTVELPKTEARIFEHEAELAVIFGKKTETGAGWFSTTYSFWGFIFGFLAVIFWCHHFGMPLVASFLFISVCFVIMLVATRIICQGGIAYFTLTAAPIDGLLIIFGAGFFSNIGILVAGVVQKVLFLDLRESLMPSLLHARKISSSLANMRMVFVGLVVTLLSGLAVSFCAMLALCYRFGVRDLKLDWAMRTTVAVYDNIYTLIESPVETGHWALVFSIVGCLVMLILIICYHRFCWWPLHPIGYLTAYSSAMGVLWFSFFVGWLCNALCHRYGGAVLYKKLGYFFAGLIIGDFLMGGIWAIVGLFAGSSYMVLPR